MGDPDTRPGIAGWWPPATMTYWPSAGAFVAAINAVSAAGDLRDGVPKPEPELKQTPGG